MMLLFVLVFVVLMLIIAAMAVGVMMGRKPLKGSRLVIMVWLVAQIRNGLMNKVSCCPGLR